MDWDFHEWVMVIVVVFLTLCGIITCSENRKEQREYLETKAYRDSVALVKQQRQSEIKENRARFYKYFSKHYDFFEDESDFSEWLKTSHEDAMELLHCMYSVFYTKYRGDNGYDYMIEDLGWEDNSDDYYDSYY